MNITIGQILSQGLKLLFKNYKFVWLFWGTNIALAAVLSLPIFFIMSDNLIHSAYSNRLSFGFDFAWFYQLEHLYKSSFEGLPYLLNGIIVIYIFIQIFFLGGLVSVFVNYKKNHFVDFFYGCVKYFYRFTKIAFISLFFYFLVFSFNDYTGELITMAFANSENQMFEFILRSSRYIFLILMIGVIDITSDYSKVAVAIKDSTKIIREVLKTVVFVKRNFFKVFIIFFIVSATGGVGAVLYNVVDSYIPKYPYYYMVLTFIIQQLLIIFRLFIRMLFYSTEVTLYNELNAELVTTNAEVVHQV